MISSIAAVSSSFMAAAFLRGGLWHDPRQPRRLPLSTGWSGSFACSLHAGGPSSCLRAILLSASLKTLALRRLTWKENRLDQPALAAHRHAREALVPFAFWNLGLSVEPRG